MGRHLARRCLCAWCRISCRHVPIRQVRFFFCYQHLKFAAFGLATNSWTVKKIVLLSTQFMCFSFSPPLPSPPCAHHRVVAPISPRNADRYRLKIHMKLTESLQRSDLNLFWSTHSLVFYSYQHLKFAAFVRVGHEFNPLVKRYSCDLCVPNSPLTFAHLQIAVLEFSALAITDSWAAFTS